MIDRETNDYDAGYKDGVASCSQEIKRLQDIIREYQKNLLEYTVGYEEGFNDGSNSRSLEIAKLHDEINDYKIEIRDLEKICEDWESENHGLKEDISKYLIDVSRYEWLRDGNIGLLSYTATSDGLEFPSYYELDQQIDGIRNLFS